MWFIEFKVPGRIVSLPLDEACGEFWAGANPEHAVCLPFKGVSRTHFSLKREGGQWTIRDAGSTNGTYINGKRISEKIIQADDVISAGAIELTLREGEALSMERVKLPSPRGEEAHLKETDVMPFLPLKKDEEFFYFPNLIFPKDMVLGRSAAMLDVYQKLNAIVQSDAAVLLTGETGVGKEMFAHTIHLSGKRSQGSFIALNCAAVPEQMAEAELFGVGKRVATEVDERKGKMVEANEGTLFLDEVEAIPQALQSKLLRALEEKKVYPLGITKAVKTDFRLVAATNAAPETLLKKEVLRQDLFHRIATLELFIPPLRERRDDIEPLTKAFLEKLCGQENKAIAGIGKEALRLLSEYGYPGNIRELLNILRAMVVLAHPGEILNENHLPQKVVAGGSDLRIGGIGDQGMRAEGHRYHATLEKVSEQLIVRALNKNGGNIRKAAEFLGLSEYGLSKAMKRLGIKAKK